MNDIEKNRGIFYDLLFNQSKPLETIEKYPVRCC